MDEVESLRERPGMAPPEPGSEVHILEQYHRSLIERTPVVWISPLLIGLNIGMFVVVAAASGSLLSITIPAMIAWGADYGPLTLAGDWWPARFCTGGSSICFATSGDCIRVVVSWSDWRAILAFWCCTCSAALPAVCSAYAGLLMPFVRVHQEPFLVSTGLLGPGTFGGVRTSLIELSGRSAAVRYRSLVSIC
jgi:hypothetical protein